MPGVEGLPSLGLGVVLELDLLKQHEGVSTHERVQRGLGGDDGLDVAVLWVEAAKKVEHLAGLEHRLANIAQAVGELLQPRCVLRHRHVTLLKGAELDLEVDTTLKLIVAEHAFNVAPDRER